VRALGAAPIVAVCAAVCGVPTVALALTGTSSKTAAKTVVAHTAAVTTPASQPARRQPVARPTPVPSRFAVARQAMAAEAGHFMTLQGRLLPAARGRVVSLNGRTGGRWTRLARGRTRPTGHFAIRYSVPGAGRTALRLSYAGGRGARATAASAGSVVGLEPTVASWYYDAGNTACGFHAYYGVANKSLPCGTHVTFEYGGRSVVATVDDRGPYVYGRSFDFNQNVSRYLGMYGVATVLSSVQ